MSAPPTSSPPTNTCGIVGQPVVHGAMLLEQRHVREALAPDDHLKVVAAACSILHGQLLRLGKGSAKQRLEAIGGHGCMVGLGAYPVAPWRSWASSHSGS